jgi:Tfp pilus assembly pilus retraction ATPase PilT
MTAHVLTLMEDIIVRVPMDTREKIVKYLNVTLSTVKMEQLVLKTTASGSVIVSSIILVSWAINKLMIFITHFFYAIQGENVALFLFGTQ